uniref:Uncharacterized protein n=1 Tax=Romanomermis culicivorax TaxID=13658 RepID=A0A915JBC9_ROMCU
MTSIGIPCDGPCARVRADGAGEVAAAAGDDSTSTVANFFGIRSLDHREFNGRDHFTQKNGCK